jgi:alcohol dehydrogenase (NADP+)
MNCAVVGCGAVADAYLDDVDASPLSLVAACDLDRDRAERLAAPHGATAYGDLDAMLADCDAPLVLNLTSHAVHAAVTRQCLRADRHVWSEKPLATDGETARALLALAEDRGLALGCAPANHRGEHQRLVHRLFAEGCLGDVGVVQATANVGRVPEWHDRPESFLGVGPLYDGEVYPLALLVAWFGGVERVRSATLADPWPERFDADPDAPTHARATLELADGPLVHLDASFYVPHRGREFVSLELHGDGGSCYLADAGDLGGDDEELVSFGGAGRPYTTVPRGAPPGRTGYLAGPTALARSVASEAPDRATARRGAHLVAVFDAIEHAAETGGPVDVAGDAPTPIPTPWVDVRPPAATLGGSGGGSTSDPGTRPAALRLPPVGFGCSRYRDGDYVDRRASMATALDAGYRFFDGAELYGNEHRLGGLLAAPGAPDRSSLFLASKVWNTNHRHVAEACETTLADLGVDALDCYLLHWPDAWAYTGPLRRLAERPVEEQEALTFPENGAGERETADVPLESTWRRMEDLVDRGLTHTLGVCNVDRGTLSDLLDIARVPPAVVQVECHPYSPREELVSFCHDRGIRVVAHSPLSAPGLLTDSAVEAVADSLGVPPASAVLAWHVDRGVVPIPASTDPDHVVSNRAAAGVTLSAEGRRRLDGLADPDFERAR